MKTYLGWVFRDVCRKIDGHIDLAARFSELLGLIERLLAQKPDDSNKLYALHAPEVVCISKGKAHKRYEFGCNVGIAATNREGLFIAAMAFEGNPYDGHTLKATAAKAEEMTGVAIQRLYVDEGYRGNDYDGKAKVMISGSKRGLTPTMKRELKRRSAIEPMIGHAKNDGRLGRNYLPGADGDEINALLAAAGHNLRLVLARLARLLAQSIGAVVQLMTKGGQMSSAGDPKTVFSNIGLRLSGHTTSRAWPFFKADYQASCRVARKMRRYTAAPNGDRSGRRFSCRFLLVGSLFVSAKKQRLLRARRDFNPCVINWVLSAEVCSSYATAMGHQTAPWPPSGMVRRSSNEARLEGRVGFWLPIGTLVLAAAAFISRSATGSRLVQADDAKAEFAASSR